MEVIQRTARKNLLTSDFSVAGFHAPITQKPTLLKFITHLGILFSLLSSCPLSAGTLVNVDFSRDIVSGTNPGANPAPVLYAGTGPATDSNTLWNDLQVALSATGDSGANTVTHPIQFNNLTASDGAPTGIDIQLTSGFNASFNSTVALASSVASLQNDRIFSSSGQLATLKIQGLNPAKQYGLYFIGSGNFSTAFTVNSVSKVASGNAYDGSWTEGGEFVSFNAITPSATGEIVVGIQDGTVPVDSFGVISGLQIVERPSQFLYASSATTTGGQFSTSYPPSNLMNSDFTSPANNIDTTVNYLAANNNYATVSGTTAPFNLTFEFATPTDLHGLHVWNYIYRNGSTGGNTSDINGVNSYTLTFYSGAGGTGTTIGSVYSGNLARAKFNALNPAESIFFNSTYPAVRSVVMRVLSNHGSAGFTGMNEVAFSGASSTSAAINSFTSSAPFVQRPATPTLNWSVTGVVTSLSISPGIGNILPLTSGGSGSISVSPIGEQTYTLTLNGTIQQTVSVVGLPTKQKVHLYLCIGQSNMQGAGAPYDSTLDAPVARVVKFGSRDSKESVFIKGGHNLTLPGTSNNNVGMGLEFGKTLLASETDPEVVIGLINHALGSSAIQWWAPGVIDNKQINSVTGLNYYLYDEAILRVNAALNHGVLKGVIWHQGEYNCGTSTNPDSDPNGYAARIQGLVTNLRNSFSKPSLPFICGKFVPATWTYADGSPGAFTGLPYRATVESALTDLPNHRTNTFCVDNNGLRGRSDQLIHFDAYSQRILGQRYATAMLNFQSDPLKLYLGGYLTPTQLANATLTDPQGDIDQDGRKNFLEYAFLTNPTVPDQSSPVTLGNTIVPGEGTFPALTFRQRNDTDAPRYTVEVSGDLVNWQGNVAGQPAVTVQVGPAIDHGDGSSTVTIRDVTPLAPGTPERFLRIRVSQP
jgi:hypothetical protein